MSNIKTAKIVKVYDTRIWVESDFWGIKHIMISHEGDKK